MSISKLIDETILKIDPLDEISMSAARERQNTLTKPLGSLGRLEELSIKLAGIYSNPTPVIANKSVILAAGDHGVVAEGVSAYPQEVTPQMVQNFLAGGAGINVLARHAGANIVILDVGVASELPDHPVLKKVKVAQGTQNIANGPAMTRDQAIQCLEIGIKAAEEQISGGADIIAFGEMGIGNTTPSSAITSVITKTDTATTTGRGTGVDDKSLDHKIAIIKKAIDTNKPNPTDGLDVLIKVGGLEIGALAGAMLATAARNKPVIVDGFISGAAALIAWTLCPNARLYFIASHNSVEPGHNIGLSTMGLRPLFDLEMRLGEGTGATLAMPIIEAAAKCLSEMATFAEAGVSGKEND
ncbi:MAG: nicotinate-nucleotide--dimethylbenzimidazole phosphoribosyltransferase [Dehalococcoidia bacterium]|nr:nicotinate-nucleotide--dimethylbenzimidazole phosphoribosyltransferase [Dehalococcoidia bacterium]|tara:strand:- start:299 stop:1369 length:1071 start_codon:yes stop_codon:yes gene_type:complete